MIGIYKFENKYNRKVYIGQSVNIEARYKAHLRNKDTNNYFHNALLRYGIDAFDFDILIECPKENLNYWEKFYIKYYGSNLHDYGYNLTEGGTLKLSEESINKGVEARKRRYEEDPTYKTNMSDAQIRRFEDAQERYKCGNSTRGKRAWNHGLKGTNSGWLKDKELPQYLKDNLHEKHVNRIWVTNEIIDKQIYKDELDTYIELGYRRGRSKYTIDKSQECKNKGTHRVYREDGTFYMSK